MIIALTGIPGVGKTQVAKILAKKLGYKLIELNRLVEDQNLVIGYDKKRKTKIVDVKKIKIQEDNVVIESHYAHDIDNDLTIVLTCSIQELRKRLEKRGWPQEKIEENIQAEIMEICKIEALELKRRVLVIDTTNKKPEDVCAEIIKKL